MPKIHVTLDPGHIKDYNRGAVSPYCEGNGMFDLALYLKDELERKGIFTVHLTKEKVTECPSLTNRGKVGISTGSRAFISLHSNGANGSAYGVTEYISLYRSDKDFATGLGDEVTKLFVKYGSSKTYNRGAVTRKGSNGDYYGVIRAAVSSPGIQHVVLVEHGFHDYKEECACLNQTKFLEELAVVEAQYIYDQLKKYYIDDSVPTFVSTVTAALNVRSGPSTNDIVLGTLSKGSLVQAISVDNGWARIIYNNCMAYVSASYLKLPTGVPSYSKVVNPLPGVESTPKPAVTETLANEEYIWTYLMMELANPYGVAGLMGNLQAESGLQPTNLQNSFEKTLGYTDAAYTAAVDSGKYTKFATDGAGYGLAQWTFRTRKQALLDYVKKSGRSIGNIEAQLEFLMNELKTSYKSVYDGLRAAQTVLEASNLVLLEFEKPASMNSSATQQYRCDYSQMIYDKYHDTIPGDSTIIPITSLGDARTTAVLNVRTGPGTSYASMGCLDCGAIIRIGHDKISSGTGWYRIIGATLKNEFICSGYISGDYVKLNTNSTAGKAYTTTAVNVRTGPGTNYTGLRTLAKDSWVYVLPGGTDNWVRVAYVDEYEKFLAGETSSFSAMYMCKEYLVMSADNVVEGNDAAAMDTQKIPYGVAVLKNEAKIYNGIDKGYKVIGTYDAGESVILTGHINTEWDQILFGAYIGYIHTSDIEVKCDIGTKFELLVEDQPLPGITPEMNAILLSLPEYNAKEWFELTLHGAANEANGDCLQLLVTAPGGTPVYAVCDGVCIQNSHDCTQLGNYIAVLALDGTLHMYSHLKSAGIPQVGDLVVAGEKIGYVGTTGNSVENQLGYQILDNLSGTAIPYDDYNYLPAIQLKNIYDAGLPFVEGSYSNPDYPKTL